MSDYMIECRGNTCYPVFKRRKFLFFSWWSHLVDEPTIDSAKTLIDNLRLINNE